MGLVGEGGGRRLQTETETGREREGREQGGAGAERQVRKGMVKAKESGEIKRGMGYSTEAREEGSSEGRRDVREGKWVRSK